jgi:predicted MFS family arabinose efflux permease
LFAALIQVWLGQELTRNHALRYGVIFIGFLATCLTVFAPSFVVALGTAPIVGFCGTFVGVSLQIGLQARLEDDLRGRIMSLWMLATTLSTSVLAIGMSALSELYGLEHVALVVIVGAGGVIASIARKSGQGRND